MKTMNNDTWEKMERDSYILAGGCKRCLRNVPINKHGDCEFCDKVMPLSIDENLDYQIAKARADERQKLLVEFESWLVDEEYPITDPDSIDYGMIVPSPKNEWNAELRAKLAEMKEGKC